MQGYGKPIIKTFIAFGGTAHLACAADVGAGFKIATTFNQEGIPVEVFARFSTIKLIHPRLNVSPKCGKPPLLLIRKFRLRLLLQVGQHAHKELVRAVIGSGSDGLLHKAVEFVGMFHRTSSYWDGLSKARLSTQKQATPMFSKGFPSANRTFPNGSRAAIRTGSNTRNPPPGCANSSGKPMTWRRSRVPFPYRTTVPACWLGSR